MKPEQEPAAADQSESELKLSRSYRIEELEDAFVPADESEDNPHGPTGLANPF